MRISSGLQKLAKEFAKINKHLYIVGGYVRDDILGLESQDIDICSNLQNADLEKICKKLKMKCIPINKNLGTIKIFDKEEKYEYTQFRSESYTQGNHTPEKVEFVDDIMVDCKRRDFTINSLYYDINNQELIDLVDGKNDIKNKIIRTTNLPNITLKDDGLRILRAIRFACTYNFGFEKNTYKALEFYKENLISISKERILQEIKSIATADLRYNFHNQIFLKTFFDLQLFPFAFNHSLHRLKKFSKIDIVNFYNLNKDSRLLGFYLLIIKYYLNSYTKINQLKFVCNMIFGLDGIKESKATIRLLEKIYLIFQNLEYDIDTINAGINYLCLTESNKNIIYAFLSPKAKLNLTKIIDIVKKNNLPLSVNDLKINAKDLIDNNIPSVYLSKILDTLYNQVIEMKLANERKELISFAKEINKTFVKISNTFKEKI